MNKTPGKTHPWRRYGETARKLREARRRGRKQPLERICTVRNLNQGSMS